jgi:hypothetical protein
VYTRAAASVALMKSWKILFGYLHIQSEREREGETKKEVFPKNGVEWKKNRIFG